MSTKITAVILSNIGVLLLTLLLALPLLPEIERKVFPPVTSLTFEITEGVEQGIAAYVAFEKLRSCEFIGLTFAQYGDRIHVDFPEKDENLPISRPEGEWVAGPWVLHTDTIDDLTITVEHRCHFLWNTFTTLYP